MSIRKIALATAGMALLGVSPMVSMASAADSIRPAAVTSFQGAPVAKSGIIRRGSRAGKSVGEQSSIFLTPVVIAIIATISIAATIIVVTDNNNSTSP